ncbi:MAG: ChbG/HpnK family deacetylase [Syntrophorhabdales bacterium]|jgi:predicted glycoside hydrolase/deacetylase ChbG (UPF0249 family)
MKKHLIINADGYGLTAALNRAIEECIEFGTVRSISANVNGPYAEALSGLVDRYPYLSVGCHLNPIVGKPVLPKERVRSLLNNEGRFLYKDFNARLLSGRIDASELRSEMLAQIELCRRLVGDCFSHIDVHMGKHRLPGFYKVFLDVATDAGVGRIRTHKYGMIALGPNSRRIALQHYLRRPVGIASYLWCLWLRQRAISRMLSMPDRSLFIVDERITFKPISVEAWISMLEKVPEGISEFIVHPGYPDRELVGLSTYLEHREREREILLSEAFRTALLVSDVALAGYRDIPRQDDTISHSTRDASAGGTRRASLSQAGA